MFGFNFWTQFIDIYKSQPALWDVNSDNYNMKQYKISAYNTLLAKLREIDPNADINMVKRKINSFRSCLRRERQKTVSMAKLGKEYVSTWKFYPYFSFINEPDPFDDDKLVNGSNITYSKEEIVISLGNDEVSTLTILAVSMYTELYRNYISKEYCSNHTKKKIGKN
ncbi:uncharacterized protein LOC119669977 [Teleopsis dalmanni]|uniref:uncharacterized protein LOC119669977 n=1 Tax=Teleopsis dalmanni TaxID=139649 RepID=UPI0018CD63F6|nr:uncharacterized protein LOC119669977 [Teleopsis dalmanni]